jgi:hypothetical protein
VPETQEKSRRFLIRHESCGTAFAIDSTKLIESCEKKHRRGVSCPKCGETIIAGAELGHFVNFLKAYERLNEKFKNATIAEIPADIELGFKKLI